MPAGNLSDQIARSLRASIISGQMVPGVTYSVPALAEEFGVSSMPVREAVLALVQRGLMSAVPNKGFRVVELTDKDLDDIMELRLMLEVPAVVNASSAVTDKLMVELRKIAKDIARAAKSGQLVDYLEADRHFHLTLTALADNPRLNDIIDDLRSRSRLTGLGTLVERGALTESAHEHVQMLDAIAAGDTKTLHELMDRHIRHSRGIWAGRAENA
jgi:DNA-binding GntR family transcriptional regulator